jgi:3-dehydroquinate dehydratase I
MLASAAPRQMEKRITLHRVSLVGVIHTAGGFAEARRSGIDAAEIRVDALPEPPALRKVAGLPVPAIITVRRADEGGIKPISEQERLASYLSFLPAAGAVDIELRSARRLREVLELAGRNKAVRIISFHDFKTTPSLAKLRSICARARGLGADIVKIASRTESPADVARLLFLLGEATEPVAVMGMGPLGCASRLLFAKAGSVLNYGWLGAPQVAGQWGAREFRRLLELV